MSDFCQNGVWNNGSKGMVMVRLEKDSYLQDYLEVNKKRGSLRWRPELYIWNKPKVGAFQSNFEVALDIVSKRANIRVVVRDSCW